LFVLGGSLSTAVLSGSQPASAAPVAVLYVTTAGSGSVCSLSNPCGSIQTAVNVATNGLYDGDDVTIEVASGSYAGGLAISSETLHSLTVAGAGARTTTVQGRSSQTDVTVGGTVNLSGLTIADGGAGGILPLYGGGIMTDGNLTLTGTTVSGNAASYGGGIATMTGTLVLIDSTVSNNLADNGGGIFNNGFDNGTLALNSSTLSGNTADDGGGIYSGGGVVLTDSTISGNTADVGGGALYNNAGTAMVGASILAANTGGNCDGNTPTSVGYNLTDDSSGADCGFTQPTDVVGSSPTLQPLGDNGGPTQTMLPMPHSPAIGRIPSVPATTLNGIQVCPRIDQRGVASDGSCTIGAVEIPASGQLRITTTSLPDGTVGQPYSATFQVTGGNPPYRWWYSPGGSLPRGLHVTSATGVLSGIPKRAGTHSVTFRVRDTKVARNVPFNKAYAAITITIVIG
jgi:hypothetical protein